MSNRGDLLRVRARFKATQAEQEPRLDRFLALMGDGAGNVAVAGSPLFVYVRVQGRGVVECLNTVAPLRNDLPLIVGYDFKKPDTLQVLSIYEGGITSFGPYAYLPAHHQAHEFRNANGGDDVVWIQKQAVIPLLCRPTSPTSMFVEVLADNYPWLLAWNLFPGATSADLTARIPAVPGDARFVLIYVDGATNVLGYSNGAVFPAAWPPGTAFSLVPAPPAGSVPVAAIYLLNGTTAIGWADIYDLRLFNQPISGGVTPTLHALLDSTVHSGTVTSAPIQGSLVVGNATPAWDDLLIGGAHQLLKVNAGGTDPAWTSFDWDDMAAGAGADMVHDHTGPAEGGLIILGLPAVAGAGYVMVSDGVNSWIVDQTPAWTGRHSFAAGITFNGGAGVNSVVIPNGLADAFDITDGVEFLRLDTTNDYFLIDPAGAGIRGGIGTAAPVAGWEVLHATDAYIRAAVTGAGGFARLRLAGDTAFRFLEAFQFGSTFAGNDTIGVANAGLALFYVGDDTSNLVIRTGPTSAANILFGTGNPLGEVMRIATTKRVGIGVTPAYKFDVLDDRAGSFVGQFFNDGDNINRHVLALQGGGEGVDVGTTYFIYAADHAGAGTGWIGTVNGVFQLQDVSDERRKTNIEDTKIVGLDIVKGLKVRDFNWKSNPNGPVMTSFVAQEAQEVYPDMVGEFLNGELGTSRTTLIPILVKAMQELDARLIRGGM